MSTRLLCIHLQLGFPARLLKPSRTGELHEPTLPRASETVGQRNAEPNANLDDTNCQVSHVTVM